MNSLYEKLIKIKKEKKEIRLGMLQKICSDDDIIDEAIEIAEHQSSIQLSGVSIFLVLIAILVSLSDLDVWERNVLVGLSFIVVWGLIKFEFEDWTLVYYDILELRRMRREEAKPTIISKLNIIISKVEEINPRIEVFEKNISNKIEAVEKEFLNIKK